MGISIKVAKVTQKEKACRSVKTSYNVNSKKGNALTARSRKKAMVKSRPACIGHPSLQNRSNVVMSARPSFQRISSQAGIVLGKLTLISTLWSIILPFFLVFMTLNFAQCGINVYIDCMFLGITVAGNLFSHLINAWTITVSFADFPD